MINLFISMAMAATFVCTIDTGTGKTKYRGKSLEDAMTKTVNACRKSLAETYEMVRKEKPSTERKILFLEYCVNNTYCRNKK